MTRRPHVHVVAAVIERGGHFLVTRRPEGVHLAGMWEFPGGKVGAGETHASALQRELAEELDAEVAVGVLLLETTHDYDDRTVTLSFYQCDLLGSITPMLGQATEWISRPLLATLTFPPADDELIKRLVEA